MGRRRAERSASDCASSSSIASEHLTARELATAIYTHVSLHTVPPLVQYWMDSSSACDLTPEISPKRE